MQDLKRHRVSKLGQFQQMARFPQMSLNNSFRESRPCLSFPMETSNMLSPSIRAFWGNNASPNTHTHTKTDRTVDWEPHGYKSLPRPVSDQRRHSLPNGAFTDARCQSANRDGSNQTEQVHCHILSAKSHTLQTGFPRRCFMREYNFLYRCVEFRG